MNSQIKTHRNPALSALLVILSASAIVAQSSTTIPFKGAFDQRDTGAVQFPNLMLTGGGAGTATYIGRFTFTSTTKVDLTNSLSTGTIQIVTKNGDRINGLYVGRGEPTNTPNMTRVVTLVTITDGTGRFRGATGALTMDAILVDDPLTGIGLSSGSLKGSIITPASK